MTCPVCDEDISDLPLDDRMTHVNRCLDQDENVSQAANKLAEHHFDACPICFKESECHIEHLKKCAKKHSVFPKDLIRILQKYEKESGTRVKNRKKGTRVKKTVTASRKESKKAEMNVVVDDDEETIPKKSENQLQSVHFTKTLTVRSGRLTTFSDLPDRKDIQTKLDKFLNNSLVCNFRTIESPVKETEMFGLSSLILSHLFVARGFDSFITMTTASQSNQIPETPVESGFLKESAVIEIDKRDELFDRLWQQKNKKSADLLIKTKDGLDVACHSFVWCMNTGKAHLTRCGSMFRADCSSFSKSVVESFVNFCYSGRMRIEAEMEEEMRTFCTHVECSDFA